jgi:hypothetical protein
VAGQTQASPWVQCTHSRRFHPRPATSSTHPQRFFFLLPTVGLHLSSSFFVSSFSSFSHFSLLSHIIRCFGFLFSYNQVIWFYFDNVFHAEVADDEWLAQKVFFVQHEYISYSLYRIMMQGISLYFAQCRYAQNLKKITLELNFHFNYSCN